ncbi:hypothetical protein GCM10020001_000300 [Nonomuraea salmonea]
MAVYLAMVLLPGFAGCLVGTGLGALISQPLLDRVFAGIGASIGLGVSWWVYLAALLGVPAVVVLAALIPASRAHRLSAAETIRSGSAPRAGRGQAIQRVLSGTRLPRSMSLGLGMPFARPGRSALTLAAIVLGVAAVTLATGLFQTMTAYGDTAQRVGHVHSVVYVGRPDQVRPKLDDAAIEALLRSQPGVRYVTADAWIDVQLPGHTSRSKAQFLRGDASTRGDVVVSGRYFSGPNEVAAPSAFLKRFGLRVGDRLTIALGAARTQATIVGEVMDASNDLIMVSWPTLTAIDPGARATQYEVQLTPRHRRRHLQRRRQSRRPRPLSAGQVPGRPEQRGHHRRGLALHAAPRHGRDPGRLQHRRAQHPRAPPRPRHAEVHRHDAAPGDADDDHVHGGAGGAIGGLVGIPIGMASHRVIVQAMLDAVGLNAPAILLDVWQAAALGALVVAGVAIAMLGAFLPARSAATLTIAEALRTE